MCTEPDLQGEIVRPHQSFSHRRAALITLFNRVSLLFGVFADLIGCFLISVLSSILGFFYQGPAINVDPNEPLVPTDQALAQVFAWFDGAQPTPFFTLVPGVNMRISDSLKSPHADELAAGVIQQLGARTSVRLDVVHRAFGNFYATRTDTTTGQVVDEFGVPADVRFVENTDLLTRRAAQKLSSARAAR